MSNPSVNILDLLANMVSSPNGVASCEIFPILGDAPVFGDLLEGLLAANGAEMPTLANPTDVATPFSLEQLLGKAVTDPKAALTEGKPNATGLPGSLDSALVDADDNILAFNRDLAELLPNSRATGNESLRQILTGEATDLESGQYKITDSKQVGESLQMEIVAEDSDADPIRITVPLDALKRKPVTSAAAQRVTLGQPEMSRAEFQRLVTNLNLKEIEVRAGSDASGLSQNSTDLTIIGEENSRRVVLEGKMVRSELQAVKTASATGKAAQLLADIQAGRKDLLGRVITGSHDDSARSTAAQLDSSRPQTTAELLAPDLLQPANIARAAQLAPTPLNLPTQKSLADSWLPEASSATTDKVVGMADTAPGNSGGMGGDMQSWLEKPQVEIMPSETGRTHRPVQFHLPDNIKMALKSHRQTITIQIEPKNLGPARLSLVERAGGLQATLIVDSAEAKSLIEGSLDKLARQLEKADIQIDKIDVSVGGDDTQRHDFERHQAWQTKRMTSRTNISDDNEQENTIPAIGPATGTLGNVSPGSLNLLA